MYSNFLSRFRLLCQFILFGSAIIGVTLLMAPSLFPSLRNDFLITNWMLAAFDDFTAFGVNFTRYFLLYFLFVFAELMVFPWYPTKSYSKEQWQSGKVFSFEQMKSSQAPAELRSKIIFVVWCTTRFLGSFVPFFMCGLLSFLFRYKELT